ncbi:Dicarboxylic amino acid permease [Leucoagaricus sp. SymC.cos]|nr:Dicarboxylic amino acid permease [Leucoagaricus sp. SymC.cos]
MDEKKDAIVETYNHNGSDIESNGRTSKDELATGEGKLVRQLKNRHIAMISIGGVIGTGLFLGTATALHDGGPIGLLLGYVVMGTICYSVMIPGGHIKLAERFVDPALSFTMGWNYWYNWTIVLPAELSAAAVLIGFWNKEINPAAWITITIVVVIIINFLGAGAYGEAEFIFASIKVITIVGLIILGIVLDLGGGPSHDRLGFRYWKHPGPFRQYDGISGSKGQFLAWWAVMTQAAFSFIGTEIVAIAAGEAKNPRRNIPRAIKRVYIRILLFYIGGVIVIGLLVPYTSEGLNLTDGTAASSPFVIAIEKAGVKVLPHASLPIFFLEANPSNILALAAASSDLYTSSRAIYGLATSGNAPRIFLKTAKNGLPWFAITFCALFTTLSYMSVSGGAGKVFGWFANMTSVAGLMTWFGISVTYIRFHSGLKAQGIDRSKLPFSSKLQPFAAWYATCFTLLICITSGWKVFLRGHWMTDQFVTNYIPLILFPILYVGARIYYRQGPIKAKDMDFVSNLAEIEAESYDDPPPRNKIEAFWQWLM